ncbi:MAG: aminotransferase DegT [Anaerolineae bacterium]|nr:DegT/DnrJ/EryC1/StrS family aminotransferase [Anaerolineales bacterium]MCQ3975793.1 aminotransferase DegT [Anaerolineae bacterium]
MLQPSTITPQDLGQELAAVVPGKDPELAVTIKRIPVSQLDLSSRIIPVCEPTLGGKEKEYVLDCLESNWISSAGKYIPAFEEKFAAECHCKYGVACANGTVALHLGLAALGLEPGDEVILPTFTMIATINAVTYTGATPILIDSEPCTWNMDVEQLARKITSKTKAIIPVHTYGHPVDMDPLMEQAEKHGIFVMEDAAEAHGAEYKGRRAGGLGHAAGFSFYANKIITTGEGGMITTNNAKFAALTQNLRDHAFSSERHFWHKYIGFNYRMTNMQAAVGLAQTEQMNDFVESRRRNAALYSHLLKEIPGIVTPPEAAWAKNVFWMYSILVEDDFGMTRDQLRAYLARHGVETRTFFIPMHLQPIYYEAFKGQRYPVAEMLCQRGFYLPSASSLTAQQIEYIAGIVQQAREEAVN